MGICSNVFFVFFCPLVNSIFLALILTQSVSCPAILQDCVFFSYPPLNVLLSFCSKVSGRGVEEIGRMGITRAGVWFEGNIVFLFL